MTVQVMVALPQKQDHFKVRAKYQDLDTATGEWKDVSWPHDAPNPNVVTLHDNRVTGDRYITSMRRLVIEEYVEAPAAPQAEPGA